MTADVEWLRAEGYDAVHLDEQGLHRAEDPDVLAKAGVESIDDWGATFCAAVTTVVAAPGYPEAPASGAAITLPEPLRGYLIEGKIGELRSAELCIVSEGSERTIVAGVKAVLLVTNAIRAELQEVAASGPSECFGQVKLVVLTVAQYAIGADVGESFSWREGTKSGR